MLAVIVAVIVVKSSTNRIHNDMTHGERGINFVTCRKANKKVCHLGFANVQEIEDSRWMVHETGVTHIP